jgi:hypothetical protein
LYLKMFYILWCWKNIIKYVFSLKSMFCPGFDQQLINIYNLLFWCINPYEIRKMLAKPVAVIVSSGWTMFGSGYENCPEFELPLAALHINRHRDPCFVLGLINNWSIFIGINFKVVIRPPIPTINKQHGSGRNHRFKVYKHKPKID